MAKITLASVQEEMAKYCKRGHTPGVVLFEYHDFHLLRHDMIVANPSIRSTKFETLFGMKIFLSHKIPQGEIWFLEEPEVN